MSSVSTVILDFSHSMESRGGERGRRARRLAEINEAFAERGKHDSDDGHQPLAHSGWLVPLPDPGCPKGFGDGVYYGAFNYLNAPALVEYLRSLSWDYSPGFQLFVKHEDEAVFSVYHLDPNALPDLVPPRF